MRFLIPGREETVVLREAEVGVEMLQLAVGQVLYECGPGVESFRPLVEGMAGQSGDGRRAALTRALTALRELRVRLHPFAFGVLLVLHDRQPRNQEAAPTETYEGWKASQFRQEVVSKLAFASNHESSAQYQHVCLERGHSVTQLLERGCSFRSNGRDFLRGLSHVAMHVWLVFLVGLSEVFSGPKQQLFALVCVREVLLRLAVVFFSDRLRGLCVSGPPFAPPQPLASFFAPSWRTHGGGRCTHPLLESVSCVFRAYSMCAERGYPSLQGCSLHFL